MPIEPVEDKWRAFGWATKVIDGHNMKEIVETFENIPLKIGKPSVVIAKTVKGKGVPFIENLPRSHNLKFSEEERDRALLGLGGS